MPVNQDDVLRVTAEMSIDGADIQNVLHFRSTNAPIIGDSEALGDIADIMDAIYTLVQSRITEQQDFDQIRVQNVTTDILLGSALWPVINAGTATGDRLPDQSAALVTLPTALSRVRGGVYLGVFSDTTTGSGSDLNAATLTAVTNFAAELLVEHVFGTSSYRYVVFNALLNTFALPVSAIAHSIWRTQRRRRQGVGS